MTNLTDRQRKLVFAGLVVALAVVGVYLTLPSTGGTADRNVRRSPTVTAPAAPATTPPGISASISPQNFDIYRLLPFSQSDFAAAADTAQRFTALYGTYRFDEDPQAYVARLQGLVTDDLRTQLEKDSATPGLIDQRKQDQVVAQGSASIDSIRTFEPNSVIFLVTGRQQVTKNGGAASTDSKQYAVTVSRDAASWRVYGVEPADAGQAGDTTG
jgi:hypothetical protein